MEDQCNGTPAIEGAFRPNDPLSAFDGESFSGDWHINIVDASGHSPGGTGQALGARLQAVVQ